MRDNPSDSLDFKLPRAEGLERCRSNFRVLETREEKYVIPDPRPSLSSSVCTLEPREEMPSFHRKIPPSLAMWAQKGTPHFSSCLGPKRSLGLTDLRTPVTEMEIKAS